MNELSKQALSLIELHEHLNFSHFLESFGTIENPTSGMSDVGRVADDTLSVADGFKHQSLTLTAMECHGRADSATRERGCLTISRG